MSNSTTSMERSVNFWIREGVSYASINHQADTKDYPELNEYCFYEIGEKGEQIFKLKGVEILEVDEADTLALYCHYPNQTQAQDCYLELELDRDEPILSCDYDGEIGGAVPFTVFHHKTLRWGIPCLKPKFANELMSEVAPYVGVIVEGFSIEWDGNNNVGRFTEEAKEAEQKIESIIEGYKDEFEKKVRVEEAGDWFCDEPGKDEINAETTDEQLSEWVKECRAQAKSDGFDEIVKLEEYGEDLRKRRIEEKEAEEDDE